MLGKFESSRYDKHMGVLKPKDIKLAHEDEKELMLENKSIDMLNELAGSKGRDKKKREKKKDKNKKVKKPKNRKDKE